MKNLLDNVFDFFFPRICLICGEKIILYPIFEVDCDLIKDNPRLMSSDFCCNKCKLKLEYAPRSVEIMNNLVTIFSSEELAISNAICLFYNSNITPIINLIYGLKYQGFTKIGIEYGKWLGEELIAENMLDYDMIIPIPIHSARRRERGYNQSEYIAKGINEVINIPINNKIIKRAKYTISQTKLSSAERINNLKDVFTVNSKIDISGKKILLVDDVLTTGSTLNYCALALLENKASKVDVATLLKA